MNPLVDNAGVTTNPKHDFAENGFEIQLGNNHQEHLYLYQNLVTPLQARKPSPASPACHLT